MIVCRECGNSAASVDGFCSSCGVLLEWSGQPVGAAAGAADSGRPPAARKPVAERTRPQPVPLVTEPVLTGPYCSACGVRNPQGRTFCRSCGALLREGAVPQGPPPGWWRRLLARMRGRRSYDAGDRPRGFLAHDAIPGRTAATAGAPTANGSRLGPPATAAPRPGALRGAAGQRVRRVKPPRLRALHRYAPVVLAVGLLGVGLGPARMWITTHVFGLAQKVHLQYVPVAPTGATASSSAPGHRGGLAVDGIQQTYWLTGAGGGPGATLTIRFGSPQSINEVGVLSGEPGGDYRTQARPEKIELIANGNPPVSLSFDDTPDFQSASVSLRHVTVITVVIKDVYPGQAGRAVALRELEFFALV